MFSNLVYYFVHIFSSIKNQWIFKNVFWRTLLSQRFHFQSRCQLGLMDFKSYCFHFLLYIYIYIYLFILFIFIFLMQMRTYQKRDDIYCANCISKLQDRSLLPYLKQTRNIYLQKKLFETSIAKSQQVANKTQALNKQWWKWKHCSWKLMCYKFEQIKLNNTSDELQMRHKAQDLHNMNNATNVQHM